MVLRWRSCAWRPQSREQWCVLYGERHNDKMQLTSGGLMARFARLHQVAACS